MKIGVYNDIFNVKSYKRITNVKAYWIVSVGLLQHVWCAFVAKLMCILLRISWVFRLKLLKDFVCRNKWFQLWVFSWNWCVFSTEIDVSFFSVRIDVWFCWNFIERFCVEIYEFNVYVDGILLSDCGENRCVIVLRILFMFWLKVVEIMEFKPSRF